MDDAELARRMQVADGNRRPFGYYWDAIRAGKAACAPTREPVQRRPMGVYFQVSNELIDCLTRRLDEAGVGFSRRATALAVVIQIASDTPFDTLWSTSIATDVAAALRVERGTVSKAIALLTEAKIIKLDQTRGRRTRLAVDPRLSWRGGKKAQDEAIATFDALP